MGWIHGRFVLLVCLSGCLMACEETREPHIQRTDGVVRVFMHEPHNYTLLTTSPHTNELIVNKVRCGNTTDGKCIRLLADVRDGESMWYVKIMDLNVSWDRRADAYEIHIRSAKDINAAGWDYGKRGRGQTQVVE